MALRENTCTNTEFYNFAFKVRDRDFADKPNEEKLQLVILGSEPESGTFSVSGRLGLQLQKPLNRSLSPYVIQLALKDQASRQGPMHNFTVYVTEGWTRNNSDSNITDDCIFDGDYSEPYDCSENISLSLFESNVSKGLKIIYRNRTIDNISKLTWISCTDFTDYSYDFFNLADDGTLVVSTYFNLDDFILMSYHDSLRCDYQLICNASRRSSLMVIYVLQVNDEAPTFTSGVPNALHVSQEREFAYDFSYYVHDPDFADWPNEWRLELLIVEPLSDSCGNLVPGSITVKEMLILTIQPPLRVTGCPPYQLTLALKDRAMTIGPYHNVTLDVTTDGDVYCEIFKVNVSDTQVVTLPRTRAGSVIEPLCVTTGQPLLVARCDRLSQDSPLAEYNVTLSKAVCSDKASLPQLVDLSLVPVMENNVVNVTTELKNLTSSSAKLQPADLSYISRILENLAQFYENGTNATALLSEVSPYVAETVSNLMESSIDVLEDGRRTDKKLTSRIVGSFDTMILKLAEDAAKNDVNSTAEEVPVVQSKNLAYQVTRGAVVAGMSACSWDNGSTIAIALSYNSTSDCLRVGGRPHAQLKLSGAARGAPRAFVVYKRAVLFGSGAVSDASVLSAQLLTGTPSQGENSSEPLVVSLRQRVNKVSVARNHRLACGYWNFSADRWDTHGCSHVPIEDEQGNYLCTCTHLTNFAVLMVPCAGECGTDAYDEVLSYISLILLAVSCVALLLVLVTFFAYRKQRQSNAQKLTACLSASLLCMNLLFIFGINAASDDNADSCTALAAALHYFLLTSFLFMSAEVILSYLRLVKVFNAHVSYFIWKALAACLGIPAALVIGVRIGEPSLYMRGDQYCWVQPTLQIYGVMLPVGVVITFNLVMFVLIARALKRRPQLRSSANEQKQAAQQTKALIAIFIVLGITWAFGLLAAIEALSVVFQYLFVISNALQGLFVFIFHNIKAPVIFRCLRNMTTRSAVTFITKSSKVSSKSSESTTSLPAKATNNDVSGITESRRPESSSSRGTKATNSDVSDSAL